MSAKIPDLFVGLRFVSKGYLYFPLLLDEIRDAYETAIWVLIITSSSEWDAGLWRHKSSQINLHLCACVIKVGLQCIYISVNSLWEYNPGVRLPHSVNKDDGIMLLVLALRILLPNTQPLFIICKRHISCWLITVNTLLKQVTAHPLCLKSKPWCFT